ncbi:MAG: NAD(P)/FAD-dependent oxidoreductase [Thermoanaerobaculia bacterium]|nr:NAD(P)/FAD-dependent oxidoreductase [Thermoanaerobaculia bacterium]
MSDALDVVVIGAGLAGLYCARDLARQGHRVAIVDRKSDPGDKVQTTGIFVRKTFVETDLPHRFLGNPLRRVRLHGPRGSELALESDKDEFRIGRMPAMYRHLLRQATDAGAVWMPRTTFEGSQQTSAGSTVFVREDGVRRELRARFVAGADGARSRVARDLGLDVNDRFLVGVEDVLAPCDGRAIDTLHCFLDGELAPGYIAWVAGDAHETHVGVAGEAGRFDPNVALERFRERVAHRFGLDGSTRAERRGGLIPVNGILKRISCDRGLLIGDAAGAVSPLTAGGLDACIRLSGAAARVLAEALRRNDGSLLAEFDGARFRARFVSRLWMRRVISSVTSAFALDAAVSLAALPPLRALARHVFFGRGSFPDVRFAFERAGRAAEA